MIIELCSFSLVILLLVIDKTLLDLSLIIVLSVSMQDDKMCCAPGLHMYFISSNVHLVTD